MPAASTISADKDENEAGRNGRLDATWRDIGLEMG
jgi:hypothetical protein